jgi:hypothetical protein
MNSTEMGMNCKTCREHLPELLFDESYAAQHPDLNAHFAACTDCAAELKELRSTMNLMDAWTAPELSPYFDSKMHVLLREAEAAQPEGFWERARSFFLYSTGRHMRPALTSALAVAMLIGGGTFGVYVHQVTRPVSSATVNDLSVLDNNAQAEQQIDQLLDDSDENAPPPAS